MLRKSAPVLEREHAAAAERHMRRVLKEGDRRLGNGGKSTIKSKWRKKNTRCRLRTRSRSLFARPPTPFFALSFANLLSAHFPPR